MRMTAAHLGPLLLIAAVLVTCSPTQTEPTAPTVSGTMLPPSPVPTSTPPPSPTPTPSPAAEPVTITSADVAVTTTPEDASGDGAFAAPVETWTRPADAMTMVYVPGGTFPMGSTEDDPGALGDEMPPHLVTLDSFWIDQTEVNNAQFVRFLNEHFHGGEKHIGTIALDRGYAQITQEGDRYVTTQSSLEKPVLMVTWHGAVAYCEWAGSRLPTEAEWEYAARGPEGRLYPWGDAPPSCDLANYGDCNRAAAPVGSRPAGASWCGALDMAGNAWEWVSDWFGPYSTRPQEDPTGPVTGDFPVLRGGGWHSPGWELRAAYRQHEVARTGFNG